ncbi:hypothetical protein [Bradyrhizobium sp. AZCC 1699]|uniref:hypothetical protein n=1 Tax=Bradyrhizobium sp. AZCC 1699 TaxID=3117024 RepID=UPI002FF0FC0F
MASSKTKPGYEAFVVSQEGSSAYWTKVGAGWMHEDGRGINLSLTPGLAVTGKIVLREMNADTIASGDKTTPSLKD